MNLGIVGTGTMGRVLYEYAREEGSFDKIYMIEPMDRNPWPLEPLDLLIDFSHPEALKHIYGYCQEKGGNIPVVLATTGYGPGEEHLVQMLEKICPVSRSTNFSRGVAVMTELCRLAEAEIGEDCDIRLTEVHHTKKKDAPSGTAKTLCGVLGLNPDDSSQVQSLRMGTVYGEHTVYFALEDEVLEVRHTALSKRIFAIGALETGKKLLKD